MRNMSPQDVCSIMATYPNNIALVHQQLLTAARQHSDDKLFTLEEIYAVLKQHPDLSNGWWQWSGDKRRSGWCFTKNAENVYRVELVMSGKRSLVGVISKAAESDL